MRQTVAALKALYVAFGGSADDVKSLTLIPDIINALAAVIAATGGTLPAVGTDDNGKVLKVAEGKWSVGTDATGT